MTTSTASEGGNGLAGMLRASAAGRTVSWLAGALVVWFLCANLLPHGAPTGVVLSGLVFGAINSLVAISIVLVYRANRVINFAAAEFGAVAAVLAIELHIQVHLNYFLCILTGLVVSGALGAVTEMTILRRFGNAPRLIVAVVTIGLAQVLNGLSVVIPTAWSNGNNQGTFTTPWTAHFTISPVVFNGNYLLAIVVVPVVLGLLVWFLRYTSYGVAIRAAADNGDRAKLLGLPVQRLSTIVWTITGVLSALAVLLRVPILGFGSFTSVSSGGPDLLLQTLTAAVIASMTSLPVAFAAAIGLGIAEQLGAWTFQNATFVDAALLVIILVALLVKRDRLTRAADTGISTWQTIRQVRDIPPEMARLREVAIGRRVVQLGLLGFALVLPFLIPPARTQLAALVLIYGIVAVSLVVLTGWAGHISLGHVAFMGFGAATTGILVSRHGIDLFVALAIGGLVAGGIAVVIGIPALRISGFFLAVVTLAFAVTSANYFLVPRYFPWFDPTDAINRPPLFGKIAIFSDRQMYFVCLVALALALAAARGLRSSHAGRALIASKENRLATQSFAIDTTRINLVAFAVSGAIAGIAGGLFVIHQQSYNFGSFNAEAGLQFFTMAVIGGLGSIPGAVLGAVYVYGSQYLLPPGWDFVATGFGIVFLLMFLPGGLGELVFRARDAALRQIATRRGLIVPSLLADSRVEEPQEGQPSVSLETGILQAASDGDGSARTLQPQEPSFGEGDADDELGDPADVGRSARQTARRRVLTASEETGR
jgi:branched-chain amino acid transport system permease protein